MRQVALSLLFVCACLHPVFSQDGPWSLERCIEYAKNNNLEVKRSEINIRLAEEQLKQSKMALIPNLNANVSQSFNFGRFINPLTNEFITTNSRSNSFSIASGVTLYDGGRNWKTIQQNNINVSEIWDSQIGKN